MAWPSAEASSGSSLVSLPAGSSAQVTASVEGIHVTVFSMWSAVPAPCNTEGNVFTGQP